MAQPSAAGDSPYRGLSIYAPFHAEVILIEFIFIIMWKLLRVVLLHIKVHRDTHHCLHHVHPPSPHFIDKLKDVEVVSLLQSLHHCIKSDESASATHTSTRGGDEQTETHTEIKHTYTVHTDV